MTVFVYNPLEDTTLFFEGRPHAFPLDQVVEVEDQVFRAPDLYKRNHPSDSDRNAMLESKMSAMDFARILLDRQYLNLFDAGFYLGEKPPTAQEKAAGKAKAQAYKRKQIDLALQERRERMAGGMGRLEFDEKLIKWMGELGIQDDLYNPDAKEDRVAAALVKALAQLIPQQPQPEPVQAGKK